MTNIRYGLKIDFYKHQKLLFSYLPHLDTILYPSHPTYSTTVLHSSGSWYLFLVLYLWRQIMEVVLVLVILVAAVMFQEGPEEEARTAVGST